MKYLKIIFKAVLRFFKKNILSIIGLIFLLFFSSATFTTINNTTNNLNTSYSKIVKEGNLHDFIVNERYVTGDNATYDIYSVKIVDGKEVPDKLLNLEKDEIPDKVILKPKESSWTEGNAEILSAYGDWIKLSPEEQKNNYLSKFFNDNTIMLFENSVVTLTGQQPEQKKATINNRISDYKSQLPKLTYTFLQDNFLRAIDNIGVSVRNFSSMNLSQNRQNLYYKIIEQKWDEKIDKIVLYDGFGFTTTSNDEISINENAYADLVNSIAEDGNPNSTASKAKYDSLEPEKKEQLNRDGRTFIELLTKAQWSNQVESKNIIAFNKVLNEVANKNIDPLFGGINLTEASPQENGRKRFFSIVKNYFFNDKGYQLIVNDTSGMSPVTATLTNKRSYESVISPSYAKEQGKECISYNEWQNQIAKPEEEFNAWLNNLSDKYKIYIDKDVYVLTGVGLTPDFMYPIVSFQKPLPNLKNEVLVYLNKDGYSRVSDAFRNIEKEEMVLGKFDSTVTDEVAAINEINEIAKKYMRWPENIKAAYLYDDTSNTMTPTALRLVYVPKIVEMINGISGVILAFIIISVLIVSFILIKRFIDINKTDIGVLLANGYKKIHVLLPLTLVFTGFMSIGIIVGYICGFGLQIPAMKLFGNFWTLPVDLSLFNFLPFLLFVVFGSLSLGLFTIGISFLVVRGDATSLIDSSSTCKINRFSIWMKKSFRDKNPISQLRFSLAFSSLFKLFTLAVTSGFIMTGLTFGMASNKSFSTAANKTFNSRQYSYSIDFDTPTIQAGQFYTVPYDQTAMSLYGLEGWEDPTSPNFNRGQYINEMGPLEGTFGSNNPNLHKNEHLIDKDQLGKRSYSGSKGLEKEWLTAYGTYQLPGISDGSGPLSPTGELQYLSWLVQSKLLINASIAGTKPWDIASKLMPSNQRKYCEDANRLILSMMSGDVTNKVLLKPDNLVTFRDQLINYVEPATAEEYKNGTDAFENRGYKKLPVPAGKEKLDTQYWKLDLASIVGFPPFGLKGDYIILMYTAFTLTEYAKVNYLMTYNKIPTMPGDKTYSYATTNLTVNGKFAPNIKITGISEQNRNFVNLVDENGSDLETKLINSKLDGNIVPVIVNKVFAKTYSVGNGDIISAEVLNTVDRKTRGNSKFSLWETPVGKTIANNFNKYKDIIVDSNNLPVDINKKYVGDHIKNNYALKIIDILDTFEGNEVYTSQQNVNKITGLEVFDTSHVSYPGNKGKIGTKGIPFNGLFSNYDNPFQVSNNIAFYAPSGLYIANDQTKAGLNAVLNYSKDNVKKAKEILGYTSTSDVNGMIEDISNTFGSSAYIALVSNVMPTSVIKDTFLVMDDTLKFVSDATIGLLIFISYVIIILITFILVSDSMKAASILKAIGLSDNSNATSLLLIYIPVILIGALITIPLIFFISGLYIDTIFAFSGILLEVPILWWHILLSSLSIIAVFIIAFFIIRYRLKKKNLADAIK